MPQAAIGWLNAPARILQAAAPLIFGAPLTTWGLSAIWLTAGIGVASFAALLALIGVMLGILPFTGGPLGRLGLGAALALDLGLPLELEQRGQVIQERQVAGRHGGGGVQHTRARRPGPGPVGRSGLFYYHVGQWNSPRAAAGRGSR